MARKPSKRQRDPLSSESWWERLPDRTRHLICLLVLLLVSFSFYAPAVFSGKMLAGGDTIRWRSMAEYMIEHRDQTGEQPLWAPNAFAGMPGYMISYPTQVPQIDTLAGILRGFIWPVSHHLFLLLGAYLLVVFLTGNKLAGVLAASAFGLTTYLQTLLIAGHNSKFITLCFVPWLVLAFAYVLRRPGLLSSLLFAIALGVNLRAGHVQITYYVAFLLGVWWIVELVGALRRKDRRPMIEATGWLALGTVLGLLLVAQPYLVNFEYKQYTIRGGGGEGGAGLDWSYAMAWSQGVGELLTLIAADAFGGASPTYWGPKPFTEGPHYLGAIVLLLAVFGVRRHRANVVTAFAAGVALMVLFSLGEHLPALNRLMYDYFPLFNAFRVPETWLIIVVFGLAVLAGIGLHHTRELPARTFYISFGALAGLMLVLLLLGDVFFDFRRPNEAAQITQQLLAQNQDVAEDDPRVQSYVRQAIADLHDRRADLFGDEVFRALIFLALAGVLLFIYQKGKIPPWMMQAGLALLVIVDLWGVGRRYFNEDRLVDGNEVRDQIATYDFDQFILQKKKEAGGNGHFRVLSLESGSPFSNARPSYHHESIGGYHGAKLRLIQDYIDHMFIEPQTGIPDDNAIDLLNTRYIVARGRLPGTQVVYQGEQTGLFVLENPDAVPRAFFVGETEVIQDNREVWERMRASQFDPRRTAILSEPIDFQTTPIDSSSTADVELQSYSPREIVWQVNTDAPRLLVVSEIYYPAGWKARVGSEETPIYRVDHLLRAVAVPQGSHAVVMRFEPASHSAGLWISAIATILVYGLVVGIVGLSWYRRRQPAAGVTA